MAITEDLPQLERQLAELITRYEQYFIGLEKREPLQLLADVEKLARRYAGIPINNTMYKHRFNMLVARFNTYREHWNRSLRLIEEGKYSRDRFIRDLRQRQHADGDVSLVKTAGKPHTDLELERIFNELREARKACHMPVEKLTREMVAATLERTRATLVARLGSDDLIYRVVVENGKPKIKAGRRKPDF